MHSEISPITRVFRPTHEWKRAFASGPLILSMWLIIILYMVELGLWTTSLINHIVTLLLGLGIYLAYLLMSFFIISLFIKPIQHIITSEGITFCSPGYCIYTPWSNIRGEGKSRLGIYRPAALLLQEPATKGFVRNGDHLERATIERHWWLTNKKDAPNDAIPLLFTVPANWQESELGLLIKQYAPQAFNPS